MDSLGVTGLSFVVDLRCVGCGKQYDPRKIKYMCADCGENLDVTYDYDKMDDNIRKSGLEQRKGSSSTKYREFLPIFDMSKAQSLVEGARKIRS
ncbi:MAG: hypothetical protein ABSA50_05735 [Candidatus Bathyarchaeia archaeon]